MGKKGYIILFTFLLLGLATSSIILIHGVASGDINLFRTQEILQNIENTDISVSTEPTVPNLTGENNSVTEIKTEPESSDSSNGIVFKNKELENAVRNYLGKTSGNISRKDLDKITMIDVVSGDIAVNERRGSARINYYYGKITVQLNGDTFDEKGSIDSIEDIKNFRNLEYLRIWNNKVTDLFPLSGLERLKYLSLDGNDVQDISPLESLKALTYLDLWKNRVGDITPLENLRNLETLYMFGNKIDDISVLSGLEKLVNVDLDKNKITDWSPVRHVKNVTGRP